THLILRRKIRAAEKRAPIGQQKSSEWPTALTGDGTDSRLITRIDIGPLVAVHLHGDEIVADDFGDFRIFVGFTVYYMAPVAPHSANIQQHGFVISLSAFECRVAPLIPINRLMRGRPQIGTGGIFQAIFRMCRQKIPFSMEIAISLWHLCAGDY